MRTPSAIATRYGDTLFRSRLEAHWAAFFDMAGIGWEYEPKASIRGWWPDFRVSSVAVDGKPYPVLTEVKPAAFAPVAVDPAFAKALHPKWTLLLGAAPFEDYVGVLACKRDEILTIAVRLSEDGLEAAPLGRRDYGGHAANLFRLASQRLPNAGISAAINKILERKMGKSLFHFDGEGQP